MVKTIKRHVGAIPNTRIKKLWSSGHSRDIDLLVVTHGLACLYEIKQPGETPEPWQHGRIKYWHGSLADTGWFDSIEACVQRIKVMAALGALMQQYIQPRMQYLDGLMPAPVEMPFAKSKARIEYLITEYFGTE